CLSLIGICFDDNPGLLSDISVATINASLLTTSITLQAHHDITLTNTSLNLIGGVPGLTFTAQAGNNINLGSFNVTSNGVNVTLSANDAASGTATGTASITSSTTLGYGNFNTNGGNVNLSGFGVAVGLINTTGTLSPGSVIVGATGDIATGSITTSSRTPGLGGGFVDLFTSGCKITVNGSIDTSGALGGSVSADGSSGGSITIASAGATTIAGGI